MKREQVEAFDLKTGKITTVTRLVAENDADRAELARLEREGKVDTGGMDGPTPKR
jgi:hypothetical protein